MSSKQIIDFSTPWPALIEAAKEPVPNEPTIQRELLDEGEIWNLTQTDTAVVYTSKIDAATSSGKNFIDTPHGQEIEGWLTSLSRSAARQFVQLVQGDLADQQHLGENSQVFCMRLPFASPAKFPVMRSAPRHGDAHKLVYPFAHRLSGEAATIVAVMVLDDRTYKTQSLLKLLTGSSAKDELALVQAHEMTHLLQLDPDKPTIASSRRAENDAENHGIAFFQTGFGGSPALAARRVLARTVASVFDSTGEYTFWPDDFSLPHKEPDFAATALTTYGLFNTLGLRPPHLTDISLADYYLKNPEQSPTDLRQILPNVFDIMNIRDRYLASLEKLGAAHFALWGLARLPEKTNISDDFLRLTGRVVEATSVLAPHFISQRPPGAIIPD
jgi:hypothetical protein